MNIIGSYKLIKKIGSGATATVYLANHTDSSETVAIKLLNESLSEDKVARVRFYQEISMLEQLDHPNIMPVLDHGEVNGRLYIVMPALKGGSVRNALRNGSLTLAQTLAIFNQIAPAIDAAHAKNILHRDIKPHNIILAQDGKAYLTDFGIARLMDTQEQTKTITLIGTPEFMAPEQVSGDALTPQTDIYQLGVMLFQMLTGAYPYSGTPMHIMSQQVKGDVPLVTSFRADLPLAVEQVVARAMAKVPEQRFRSALQLVNALHNAIEEESLTLVVPPLLDVAWPEEDLAHIEDVDEFDERINDVLPLTTTSRKQKFKQGIAGKLTFSSLLLLAVLGYFFFELGGNSFQSPIVETTAVPTAAPQDVAPLTTIEFVADIEAINEELIVPLVEDVVAVDEEVVENTAVVPPAPQEDASPNNPPPPPPRNNNGNRDGNGNRNGNNNEGNNRPPNRGNGENNN